MSNPMRSESDNRPWFALRVKPNHEKRVSELINYQGLEEFLPLYRVRRRWAQRWQNIDTPLFPGYVFSRFERHSWAKIMNTPGVVDAVRFGNTLAAVDEEEIQALQLVQRSKTAMQPSPYLRAGQRMRVTAGPLAGVNGTLTEIKGVARLVLSVSLLQRSVLVEIDRSWVTYDPIPNIPSSSQPHA
jgi:transcription antitermination factor NusG